MLFSNQPWTEKSVNQSYCYLVYAAPLDNIQKRHFIHIVGSSSPIDVLLGSFTAGCSFYDNCIVHHIQFCPVNLLLISRRAFGSLDTNSGGTAVVSLEGVLTGRERRLPFILRWNVWEPSGQVLALSTDVTAKDSFGLLLRSFRGCRSVSFPLAFLFLLTNCFILLFSRREYNSMRYSVGKTTAKFTDYFFIVIWAGNTPHLLSVYRRNVRSTREVHTVQFSLGLLVL